MIFAPSFCLYLSALLLCSDFFCHPCFQDIYTMPPIHFVVSLVHIILSCHNTYPGSRRGVHIIRLSLDRRMMLMNTYEEMQILLTFALLVVAILNLRNK